MPEEQKKEETPEELAESRDFWKGECDTYKRILTKMEQQALERERKISDSLIEILRNVTGRR